MAARRVADSVAQEPLKVQMLGLLPAVLKPCGPACAQPFMTKPVRELASQEMDETPAFVRENGSRAHEFAEELLRDFGDRLRIEVIGLDSPRGLWLGLRHRIGNGFAVVVDGHDTFRSPEAYGPIHDAVTRALERRDRTGT